MKILNVHPEERKALVLFSLVMLVNMLTLEGTFVVSTSGFLATIGVTQLPLLWIIDMALILLGTTLISAVIDRWPRKQFLSWIIFGLAIFYLFFRILFAYDVPDWGAYPFLYLIAEQQVLVIPIVYWAMANDMFNIQQTKRLFPLIAASGVIGGIVGNAIAVSLAGYFAKIGRESYELLIINAFLLFLLFVVYQFLGRSIPASTRQSKTIGSLRNMFADGLDFVKNVELFKYLVITMLGVGFALTMIEYLFLDTLIANYQGAEFQSFYGIFRIAQTISIVLVQSLLTGRLLNKVELKRIFMFLPVACGVVIIVTLALPAIVVIVVARLIGRMTLSGIDEPARKSLQGLIPDEKRGRVSSFLDGYLFASSTIVASFLLFILLWGKGAGWLPAEWFMPIYLIAGAIGAIVAIWAASKVWQHYDQSMLNFRLARRKRGSSLIDF
jgi:MFS family permease